MTDAAMAVQTHAFTPPYMYDYPQASPCGAVLIYCRKGRYDVALLTSLRAHFEDDVPDDKRNQAAGGFYEVKDMFTQVSKVQDGDAELYREMTEELGEGIKDIIPYEEFVKRRKYLWDGMTRIRDTHIVHMQVHKTLEVSEEEMDKIMALPPTKERKGFKLEEFELEVSDMNSGHPDSYVRERLADFLYPNEVEMAVRWFRDTEQTAKRNAVMRPEEW